MAVLLVLTLLTVGMAAESCPIFTCASLESDVCAVFDASFNAKINSNGCESGMGCFFKHLEHITSPNYKVKCFPWPEKLDFTGVSSNVFNMSDLCNITLLEDKAFKNGQTTPFMCNVDKDCLLEDGTYTICGCTVRGDGKKVCSPDIANHQIFPSFYEFCQKGDFSRSKIEEYYYYLLYYLSFEILHSDLECLDQSQEWKYLTSSANSYVSVETSEGRINLGTILVLEVLLCVAFIA